MERIKAQYRQLLKAYKTLDLAINYLTHITKSADPILTDIYHDSLIQRFEFCYDLSWKYLKEYLRVTHGIELRSPKTVFQECLKQKIITEQETALLLEMVDARNSSSHIYDEEMAATISKKIPKYAQFLHELARRIAPK